MSVAVDLATSLSLAPGGKAWLGFTAGTGGEAIDKLGWAIRRDLHTTRRFFGQVVR